jgi:hypothetical protein
MAQDTNQSLGEEFDNLMQQFESLIRLAVEGLDPATPDRRRQEIRAVLSKYLES